MNFVEELLQKFCESSGEKIAEWIAQRSRDLPRLFYTSIDFRNADFKFAPVDVNLFPAGFNNLTFDSLNHASKRTGEFLKNIGESAKSILIIIEDHDRNQKYFENVSFIRKLFEENGVEVKIANFANKTPRLTQAMTIHALEAKDGRIITEDGFSPDVILLNNDLTKKPEILESTFPGQLFFPNPESGWHKRRKSNYFEQYTELVKEFAAEFEIDPWLITPFTKKITGLDTNNVDDLEKLKEKVEIVLKYTSEKYKANGIHEEPFCYLKDNKGTYGMGVIHVTSSSEVTELNRKKRSKISSGKQGEKISEFIVQEGIPTKENHNGSPAEKTCYMINGEVIGGFFRVNKDKDIKSNLNSSGATFQPIGSEEFQKPMYQLVSKLAYLALQLEVKAYGEAKT